MGKLKEIKNGRLAMFAMLGITYRQLQQERVQLLIGQSTLQIQEQSTLGTMQQSSLQHYSVLGSHLGVVYGEYGQDWWRVHWSVRRRHTVGYGAVRSYSKTWYRLVQARCRLPGRHTGKLHHANQSLYANY